MAKRQVRISPALEQRVLGFLSAKGLLIAPHVTPKSSVKIRLADALTVGLHIEPRVIEVLPAAILHFPKSFLGMHEMPEKLRLTLDCIRSGAETGPSLAGIPYEAMLRWANEPLPDKRTKPERERKVTKAFRLKKTTLENLKIQASQRNMSETEFLEWLLGTGVDGEGNSIG